MDWKRRSDQSSTRYESDEGTNFEENSYIDASSYESQSPPPQPGASTADHARYEQPSMVDPVFAERGRTRRERQAAAYGTPRGNAPTAARTSSRRRVPIGLLLGALALIALPLVALVWFANNNRDGAANANPSASVRASGAVASSGASTSALPSSSTSATGASSSSSAAASGAGSSDPASGSPSASDTAGAGASDSAEPSTNAAPAPRLVVTGTGPRGVYLRQQASTSAPVITTLKEGTEVEAIDQTANADNRTWQRVRTPEGEGWVASDFLRPAP